MVHDVQQSQWEKLVTKAETTQAVPDHDEAFSSYWLLAPFKHYAYWWSFAFAYFSGDPFQSSFNLGMLPAPMLLVRHH